MAQEKPMRGDILPDNQAEIDARDEEQKRQGKQPGPENEPAIGEHLMVPKEPPPADLE